MNDFRRVSGPRMTSGIDVFWRRNREAQLGKNVNFLYVFKGFSRFGAPRIRRETVAERSRSPHALRTPFRDGFRTILESQNDAKTIPNRPKTSSKTIRPKYNELTREKCFFTIRPQIRPPRPLVSTTWRKISFQIDSKHSRGSKPPPKIQKRPKLF